MKTEFRQTFEGQPLVTAQQFSGKNNNLILL